MSRPVIEAVLESIGKLPAVIAREVFGRDRRSGDVAEHALEGVPFMGLAPPAGLKGESPTPSDARSEYQGIACDRAQRQGLVPGVGADRNAVVDGGDDECPELVDGLQVEGVGLVVAQRQPLLFHRASDTGGDTMEQALDATLRRCTDSAKTGVLLFEHVGPVDEEHVQLLPRPNSIRFRPIAIPGIVGDCVAKPNTIGLQPKCVGDTNHQQEMYISPFRENHHGDA